MPFLPLDESSVSPKWGRQGTGKDVMVESGSLLQAGLVICTQTAPVAVSRSDGCRIPLYPENLPVPARTALSTMWTGA